MRKALAALAALIAAYWSSHNTRGRIWLTLGVVALANKFISLSIVTGKQIGRAHV